VVEVGAEPFRGVQQTFPEAVESSGRDWEGPSPAEETFPEETFREEEDPFREAPCLAEVPFLAEVPCPEEDPCQEEDPCPEEDPFREVEEGSLPRRSVPCPFCFG